MLVEGGDAFVNDDLALPIYLAKQPLQRYRGLQAAFTQAFEYSTRNATLRR